MADHDNLDHAAEALSASPRPAARPPVPRMPGTSPAFAMGAGIVGVLVGGAIASLGTGFFALVGAAIGVFGFLVALIGVVAAGVRLGLEWADYDREVRRR